MIKLKNLWKIALATMAMSTMLVACDDTSKEREAVSDSVSISVDLNKISKKWGGNSFRPSFSILYLTEAHMETAESSGKLEPKEVGSTTSPVYQLSAFNNIQFDSVESGTYVPFGKEVDNNGNTQYYEGIAATVTDTNVTVFIKTSSIKKQQFQQLGAGFIGIEEGKAAVTADDEAIMDLSNYKPYVLALVDLTDDIEGIECAWGGDIVAVTTEATFPTDAQKKEPNVYDHNAINQVRGSLGGVDWDGGKTVTVKNKILTYEFTVGKVTDNEFAVTTAIGWAGDKYCGGAEIVVGGPAVNIKKDGDNAKVTGLAVGASYVLTVDFSTENVTAKVTAK